MIVMLIDRSGRGHALADWFLRTDSQVIVHYVPGCQTLTSARLVCCQSLRLDDFDGLVAYALNNHVDFVFVASAPALAAGLVDNFVKAGIPAIGPDKRASQLESSKVFAKLLCTKYGIPVADYACFDSPQAAIEFIDSRDYEVVVKADGLAQGRGSFVCSTPQEAHRAVELIMQEREFGDSGNRVVIERRLTGTEISIFAFFDGKNWLLLPMALDYKRAEENDLGPNGGGMGAISPHPLDTPSLRQQITAELLNPITSMMHGEEFAYVGVLYIGAMLCDGVIKVLEFNVRLGDPEAEVIVPRIDSSFVDLCQALINGTLDRYCLATNSMSYCDVVITQGKTRQISNGRNKGWYKGWPYGRYGKHYAVTGLDSIPPHECRVFIGEATHIDDKGLASDGGRVIHVVGFGESMDSASANAYRNAPKVLFEGARFRRDIGRGFQPQNPETLQRETPFIALGAPQSSLAGTSFQLLDFEGRNIQSKVPFSSSIFRVQPGAVSKLDSHAVLEMWFVAQGSGTLQYDDQSFVINAFETVVFDRNKTHRVMNRGQEEIVLLSVWWG